MLLMFFFGLSVGAGIGLVVGALIAAAHETDAQRDRELYEQKIRRAASVVRNDGHRAT